MALDGVRLVRSGPSSLDVLEAVGDDVFDGEIDPILVGAASRAGQLLTVAVEGGVVVGQVQAMVQRHVDGGSQLYIDNLGVSPSHQRRGIARALVEDAVAWSKEFGCEQVWIVTEPDNEAANALYSSLGARRSTVMLYSFEAT